MQQQKAYNKSNYPVTNAQLVRDQIALVRTSASAHKYTTAQQQQAVIAFCVRTLAQRKQLATVYVKGNWDKACTLAACAALQQKLAQQQLV